LQYETLRLAPLRSAEHQLLAQTGPGSLVGTLLRRYWTPALLSEEIPLPDCPPVRVGLLGESLIAFRDSHGRVGLLYEHCAHRGSSLFLGRNEADGLRCSYHGWKYGVDGACQEVPNVADPSFPSRVRQVAYPCREVGGVVFAYLGPPDTAPPLPDIEWFLVPEESRYAHKRLQECNWLQALELDIDSSHVAWLHRESVLAGAASSEKSQLFLQETAPDFDVRPTDYGLLIAARRNASDDRSYWRINQWLMPWYTTVPAERDGGPFNMHAWVPIDDHTSWTYSFTWDPDRALEPQALADWKAGRSGIYCELEQGTYRPRRNMSNDWEIDRTAQQAGRLWVGIHGNQEQDNAIAESMGPMYDRTRELLVPTDAAVQATRQRILDTAQTLQKGREPFGLDPSPYRVHPVSAMLPREMAWQTALADRIHSDAITAESRT
jgi:phenylpropionate dioxygenase-like ring-hydroxylating dioxygenase large terminal subunit